MREATDLQNPIDVVEWNLDKHYLAELSRAGVPTTPTTFVEPGDRFDPPDGEYVLFLPQGGSDAVDRMATVFAA